METGAPVGTLVLDDERPIAGSRRSAHWWMLDESGDAVAFMKTQVDANASGEFSVALTVCDIEVRDDVRGRGWARAIIAAVEAHYGQRLHTSGGYTPLGFKALGAHLPVAYGNRAEVRFEDVTFVADWSQRRSQFRL
jgi:GNAT superfamily N-acetyltransferase